jgi:hypothetical protein
VIANKHDHTIESSESQSFKVSNKDYDEKSGSSGQMRKNPIAMGLGLVNESQDFGNGLISSDSDFEEAVQNAGYEFRGPVNVLK